MPCTKCEDGKYKWGKTGECKYDTKEACEKANPKKYNKMRPTPLGKKTYEEYAKELKEFNLSSAQRFDLALVDDVKKVNSDIDNLLKDSKTEIKEVNSTAKTLRSAIKKEVTGLNKRRTKLEKTISSLSKAEKQNLDLTKKADKAAKELGVNSKDIPGYNDLDSSYKKIQDQISDIENAISLIDDFDIMV